MQEHNEVNDWREGGRTLIGKGYLKEPFVLDDDGCVAVPDKPGLGIDIGRRWPASDHGAALDGRARVSARPSSAPLWRAVEHFQHRGEPLDPWQPLLLEAEDQVGHARVGEFA